MTELGKFPQEAHPNELAKTYLRISQAIRRHFFVEHIQKSHSPINYEPQVSDELGRREGDAMHELIDAAKEGYMFQQGFLYGTFMATTSPQFFHHLLQRSKERHYDEEADDALALAEVYHQLGMDYPDTPQLETANWIYTAWMQFGLAVGMLSQHGATTFTDMPPIDSLDLEGLERQRTFWVKRPPEGYMLDLLDTMHRTIDHLVMRQEEVEIQDELMMAHIGAVASTFILGEGN